MNTNTELASKRSFAYFGTLDSDPELVKGDLLPLARRYGS